MPPMVQICTGLYSIVRGAALAVTTQRRNSLSCQILPLLCCCCGYCCMGVSRTVGCCQCQSLTDIAIHISPSPSPFAPRPLPSPTLFMPVSSIHPFHSCDLRDTFRPYLPSLPPPGESAIAQTLGNGVCVCVCAVSVPWVLAGFAPPDS